MPAIKISATSGRENSGGGSSPLLSISRTCVPLRTTCDSLVCGHVLVVAMPSHFKHQNECSKNNGVMPNSSALNSEKMC